MRFITHKNYVQYNNDWHSKTILEVPSLRQQVLEFL